MQSMLCNLCYAICVMQSTVCNLYYAIDVMQSMLFDQSCAFYKLCNLCSAILCCAIKGGAIKGGAIEIMQDK